MPNYKKMYHVMFNAVTDAERLSYEALEMMKNPDVRKLHLAKKRIWKAVSLMRAAQRKCEELYIEADEISISIGYQAGKR